MRDCKGHLGKDGCDSILKKIYGNFDAFETNSDSSSSGSVEIIMEMHGSSIDLEVASYNRICIDDWYISQLQSKINVSSTSNEIDVILEPCI